MTKLKYRGSLFGVALFALSLSPSPEAQTVPATPDASARATITVQAGGQGKKISSDLFGIFFEDINYAADGGLYAELIQNRSFEYSARDNRAWSPLTSWELATRGEGKGAVAVEAAESVHANNPQYGVLTIEQGGTGIGLMNSGFDGIVLKAGEEYNLTFFAIKVSGKLCPSPRLWREKTGRCWLRRTWRM